MARQRKPASGGGGGQSRGRKGSATSKRKKTPQLEKSSAVKPRPKRTSEEEDTSDTSEDDPKRVRVAKPPPKRTIEDDDETTSSEDVPKEKTIEDDTKEIADDSDESPGGQAYLQLENENERLRKKIKKMQEDAIKGGGDNQLNSLHQIHLGMYVKETLFRKAKFVDHRKLNSGSNIMNLCFNSIGLMGESRFKYSLHVKKLLRHYLSQRRNYVAQQLKKCVMGKYYPGPTTSPTAIQMNNILFHSYPPDKFITRTIIPGGK